MDRETPLRLALLSARHDQIVGLYLRNTSRSSLALIIVSMSIVVTGGVSIYPIAVFGNGGCTNGPGFTLAQSPTSVTVSRGSNASFFATLQSQCKFSGSGHYTRTLTPTVTNGPQLPPNSCYHGCNNFLLQGQAGINTVISTSSITPSGTYNFTLTVTVSGCGGGNGSTCLVVTHSVGSTLTVT